MWRKQAATLIFLVFSGCAQRAWPTDSQRSQSFLPLEHSQLGGEPLRLFLQRRTAVLINGTLAVAEAGAKGQTLGIRFASGPNQSVNGPSHALAIDSRGYFLTAAHCLDHPHVYLIYSDGQTAHIAVPRVVANVNDTAGRVDFAILHVDATLPYVFEWSDSSKLASGQLAAAVGISSPMFISGTQLYFRETCLAGHVTSTVASKAGAIEITHDLPLRRGDSGGPLTTGDGRLFGVNTGATITCTGASISLTVRPSPEWVAHVIAEDLQEPREKTPAMANTLKAKTDAHLIVALSP